VVWRVSLIILVLHEVFDDVYFLKRQVFLNAKYALD